MRGCGEHVNTLVPVATHTDNRIGCCAEKLGLVEGDLGDAETIIESSRELVLGG